MKMKITKSSFNSELTYVANQSKTHFFGPSRIVLWPTSNFLRSICLLTPSAETNSSSSMHATTNVS